MPLRRSVGASQQLLQRYKHNQLDTEHFLLAMLEQEGGVVPRILATQGVDVKRMTGEVERSLGRRPQVQVSGGDTSQIYLTPAISRVLDRAWEVCQRFGDQLIATEHILLAMLEDGQTEAGRILAAAGVTTEGTLKALQGIRGAHSVMDAGRSRSMRP